MISFTGQNEQKVGKPNSRFSSFVSNLPVTHKMVFTNILNHSNSFKSEQGLLMNLSVGVKLTKCPSCPVVKGFSCQSNTHNKHPLFKGLMQNRGKKKQVSTFKNLKLRTMQVATPVCPSKRLVNGL